MPEYMSAHNAEDLLEALSEKGFAEGKEQDLKSFVLEQQEGKELPLYIRALVGVGAFIASLCLIALMAIGFDIDETEGFLVVGLLFIALAISLIRFGGDGVTIKHSFMMQSSFALMAAGKALFVFAIVMIFESAWAGTLAILTVTVATYHVYRMSIDRFLSTYAVLFSIHINVLWIGDVPASKAIFFNLFVGVELLLAAILIWSAKVRRDYIPVTYALLFSLCTAASFLASRAEFAFVMDEEVIAPYFTSLLFTIALSATIVWIAGGLSKLKSEAVLLGCLGAIILGVLSAPGVLLAIILMVLGYGKHEKIMIAMGALLLPLFLYHYYYNLDVSLLEKSGVLVGSGLLLLAARFYISFRKWDKGAVA